MRGTRQMRRWRTAAVIVITMAAALAAAGASQEAGGVRHCVEIHDFAFVPAYLAAAPGDTVVWVNHDLVPHTITARDESWDSQAVPSNEAWELRVTEEMTGGYFCRYHPFMEGQVAVKHH